MPPLFADFTYLMVKDQLHTNFSAKIWFIEVVYALKFTMGKL